MSIRKQRKMVINYSMAVEERIARAKKNLPWTVKVHAVVIADHNHDENDRYISGQKEYKYRLFEFPENTPTEQIVSHMRKWGWSPANPAHMLEFAASGSKRMFYFGKWHQYIVGLGGTLHTVLGCQFGGLNFGNTFFFQHVPQDKPMHQGGEDARFLAVKE